MSTRVPLRSLFSEAGYCLGAGIFVIFGTSVLCGLSVIFAAEAARVWWLAQDGERFLAIPFAAVSLLVIGGLVAALRREVPLQGVRCVRLVRCVSRAMNSFLSTANFRGQPAAGFAAAK